MAETTFTFFDSDEAEKTALAGANGSGHLAPAAVLYDVSGAELKGQKARSSSVPVALSTEDVTALTPPAAISGFATAANQTTELASLASILAKLSSDPATQTTLALILAKIISAPATEAKQDALNALIGEVQASPTSNTLLERLKAIQTALAGTLTVALPTGASTSAKQDTQITAEQAILAKLIAAPATEAKQDTGNTSLASIATLLTTQAGYLDGLESVEGTTADAAVSTDANGTINAHIRGQIVNLIAILAALGAAADAAVTAGATGSINAHLRSISRDLVANIVLAAGANVIGGVTQSGTWTVQPGNTPNTTPWLAKVHDGTNAASVRSLANNALNVAVTDSSGAQISSFGGTTTRTPTGTMTRTADTNVYAAGDGVTTATSSASAMTVSNAARTSAGGGVIFGGKASKSATSTTNAQFRLWIYQATPTAIPNDNAAFTAATQADYQKLVGTALVDFTAGITGSDGVRVPIVLERPNMAFQVASGTDLIVIWEARAAYTPASAEVFRLSLDAAQD